MLSKPLSPDVASPVTVRKVPKELYDLSYTTIVPPFCTINTRSVRSPALTICIGELNPVMTGVKDKTGCATELFENIAINKRETIQLNDLELGGKKSIIKCLFSYLEN